MHSEYVWEQSCYSCDIRADIKVVERICKLSEVCKTEKLPEINKTGTLPHGISGFAVFVYQHITQNCLIHTQSYSFKDSTKENKQSIEAFNSEKSEIRHNTNVLRTGFLAQFPEG